MYRLYEEDLQVTIESRTESLQALRELGPPDLVHLMRIPVKGASKQVRRKKSLFRLAQC
jgi:hypothetical protein